jgi:hypothetical protein
MSTTTPALLHDSHLTTTLSPLEQEVLDEYARLLGNMNTVRFFFSLSTSPPLWQIQHLYMGISLS